MLTQVLPYPPDAGPKIKTFNVLRYLAQEGHEVTLVSFIRSEQERAYARCLEPYCSEVRMVPLRRSPARDLLHLLRSLVTGQPFLMARDWSDGFLRDLNTAVAGCCFDLVHADQLNMAQYALRVDGIPRILDEHNAVWTIVHRLFRGQRLGLKKLALYAEYRKLKRYEAAACRAFDHILTVSEEDRLALIDAGVDSRSMTVIPIGVDCAECKIVHRRVGATSIISLGTMFYPPNVEGVLWFAREVFPLIKSRLPDIRFCIIGARPPIEVRRLAEQDSSITVPGYVSDLAPYVQESAALIVPLMSGGGMRVKVLEAFAMGIPVVSTTIGCEGINVTPGRELLVADRPSDFADSVLRLITDRALAQGLVGNALALVRAQYDWKVACRPVGDVYASLSHRARPVGELEPAGVSMARDGEGRGHQTRGGR